MTTEGNLQSGSPQSDENATLPDSVFVVIAAYNEASVIGSVVQGVQGICPNVVVVDDGSRDSTEQEASRYTQHTLRHMVNRGQGAALQTGIEYALRQGAAYIVTFDADGQHRPSDIPKMLTPIVNGDVHITLGSRFLGGAQNMPTHRRAVLKLAVLFTRVVNRMPLSDAHNGFRALSRDAAQRINLRADRMAHASEILDQIRETGLPFQEVPVHVEYTEYSLAKGQSSRNAFRIVFHYFVGKIMGD